MQVFTLIYLCNMNKIPIFAPENVMITPGVDWI